MSNLKRPAKKLFNRTAVCVFGIAVQIGYFASLCLGLGFCYNASFLIFQAIGVVVSMLIVNSDINPSYKIAWILVIMAFPIFGVMFCIFLGNSSSNNKLRKKLSPYIENERFALSQNEKILKKLEETELSVSRQAEYLTKIGGCAVYDNTKSVFLPNGEDKFEALLTELENAHLFIYLEYFIIAEGKMWNTILEILERKANEGVDVRVIYDDIGCLLTLPDKYNNMIESKGIKCRVFNKFKPFLSKKMNNRDHRKIFIIDGKTAFTGGINLADEYINEIEKHGHWKDSAVMIKGDAAQSFTVMFLTMWNYLSGEKPTEYPSYLQLDENSDYYGSNGFVIPFTDSPLDDEPVGENVYLNIINNAQKYVYITTPYLVIDNEMQNALTLAAKSGVDVRIITPHIPDKWYVHSVTKAHYKRLTGLGVKIYEYTPGFIHSKTFVSDDTTAVVGTINLDYRSLYLHFECAVWLYKSECISNIKEDFLKTLDECEEVTYDDCLSVNFFVRLLRAVLKLFSPLM